MIFFFNGYGLFTAAIGILAILILFALDGQVGDGVIEPMDWFFAMLNAACINLAMCKLIKRRKEKGNYSGGAKLLINQRHSLFFLPISLWTYIYLFAGIYWGYVQPYIHAPK